MEVTRTPEAKEDGGECVGDACCPVNLLLHVTFALLFSFKNFIAVNNHSRCCYRKPN